MLCALLQLEALAKAAEEDLERDRAEGADIPAIRAFEDFKKKMRRRGDSDKKRAEKLARRHARCTIRHSHTDINVAALHACAAWRRGCLSCLCCQSTVRCPSPLFMYLRPLQSKGGAARSGG